MNEIGAGGLSSHKTEVRWQSANDWLASPEGQQSLDAAMQRSERRIERLEHERRVEPDMLHQPITL